MQNLPCRFLFILLLCFKAFGDYLLFLEGKINDVFRITNASTNKLRECWYYCNDPDGCSVSYKNHECIVYRVPSQLLVWEKSRSKLLKDDGNGWHTIAMHKEVDFQPPLILWVFDNVTKGSNLGSGGPRFDMRQTNGLFYDMKGPSPSSPIPYARRRGGMYDLNRISIKDGKKLLFDFSKPFTFATWFRVENPADGFDLLTGSPTHSLAAMSLNKKNQFCQIGMGEPCYNETVLKYYNLALTRFSFLHSGISFDSDTYPAPKDGWMHFTFVSKGGRKHRFYFNGKPWPSRATSYPYLKTPTALTLWSGTSLLYKNLGQACVAFSQTALDEVAVLNLMKACP